MAFKQNGSPLLGLPFFLAVYKMKTNKIILTMIVLSFFAGIPSLLAGQPDGVEVEGIETDVRGVDSTAGEFIEDGPIPPVVDPFGDDIGHIPPPLPTPEGGGSAADAGTPPEGYADLGRTYYEDSGNEVNRGPLSVFVGFFRDLFTNDPPPKMELEVGKHGDGGETDSIMDNLDDMGGDFPGASTPHPGSSPQGDSSGGESIMDELDSNNPSSGEDTGSGSIKDEVDSSGSGDGSPRSSSSYLFSDGSEGAKMFSQPLE